MHQGSWLACSPPFLFLVPPTARKMLFYLKKCIDIEDEWRQRAKFTITILLKLVCFLRKLNNGSKLFAIILRSCWYIVESFENIFPSVSWFYFKCSHFLPIRCLFGLIFCFIFLYLFYFISFKIFARKKILDWLGVAITVLLSLEYYWQLERRSPHPPVPVLTMRALGLCPHIALPLIFSQGHWAEAEPRLQRDQMAQLNRSASVTILLVDCETENWYSKGKEKN